MEASLFDQVLEKIKQAQADGEITPERQATLTTMFQEFMTIYSQPDGSIEQMAAKQAAMREIIERYKDVLNNPQLGRG